MNVPNGMRPFSLEMAQKGHPICTRTGTPAKFIAYVPDNQQYYKVVVSINGEIYSCGADGVFTDLYETETDLFLAPLGYCEGKPVFAGDKLIGTGYGTPYELIADTSHNEFSLYKWPSKEPIVETRMTENELEKAYWNLQQKHHRVSDGALMVANKAIERAILDGDVIPTSVVKELMQKAAKHCWKLPKNQEKHSNKVLSEYLEGLK